MKELLIEFFRFMEYDFEEVDDNLFSIRCERWAGDDLVAAVDDENNMITFTNPGFYEVSCGDESEVARVFSAINDANVEGRVRVFYEPTDRDTFAVSATANLIGASSEEAIVEAVPEILTSLLAAHTVVEQEFWAMINEIVTETLAKAEPDNKEESEDETRDKDNKAKLDIVSETLKEMQCVNNLSEKEGNMVNFRYQGMPYCLCVDGGDAHVTLYTGVIESFDVTDVEYASTVRKILNYLNGGNDTPIVYIKDHEEGNLCDVFCTSSLRCTNKETFKDSLQRFTDNCVSMRIQYTIILELLTGSIGIKENYMLNYDL